MLKNKYVSIAVAVFFVLVIAYNLKFFLSRKPQPPVPSFKMESQAKPSTVKTNIKSFERTIVDKDKGIWKRDPFDLQSAAVKTGTGEIQLTGIIKRDGKSHALINGRVFSVNDRVGDSVIKEIKRYSIVLSTNGAINEIYLDDYKVPKEKKK